MRQKILLTFALLLAIAQGAWGAIAVDGKLPGAFSVSATKQVWFSQGNLQYQANSTGAASAPYTGVWRFATNQYEAIGSGNSNVSASYGGWIDFFGWGSGNQPTQTSEDPNTYSSFVDWGTNVISNGGNTANLWRTLSESEWTYIISTRPNASNKRGRATINGMYCYVLLPDDWVLPSGLSFTPDANNWTNEYTTEQWIQMEDAGAVCFPAAGSRAGGTNNTNVNDYNRWCCYWSSTSANSSQGYNLWITSDHVGTIDKGNYQMGASVRLVSETMFPGSGTEEVPYLISSEAAWNYLADQVSAGNTYSGKYFRQTEDISVSTMVGATSSHKFSGTYDGDGHTLTVNYNSTAQYAAPFSYADGATFKNLHIAGSITSSAKYVASFVGYSYGSNTFFNCRSSVAITSSITGDGTHGGFVGILEGDNVSDYTVTFEGCVFNGKLLGSNTTNCGGFVGWSQTHRKIRINLSNCLYAPQEVTISISGCQTFSRGQVLSDIFSTNTNNYYIESLGGTQGKQACSISAGDDVTINNLGDGTEYNVSGITAYAHGIKYGGTFYAGNGDVVSLNLSHDDNPGSTFSHYAVTGGGTLSAQTETSATLTMTDANQTINVRWGEDDPAFPLTGSATFDLSTGFFGNTKGWEVPSYESANKNIGYVREGGYADGYYVYNGNATAYYSLYVNIPWFKNSGTFTVTITDVATNTTEATATSPTITGLSEFFFTIANPITPGVKKIRFDFHSANAELNDHLYNINNVSFYRRSLNEDDDYTPIPATGVDVVLGRTLNAGGWNTFCVPFNISSEMIASVFGENTKVRELNTSEFNSTTKTLTLNFTEATSIEAGKPYLVKVDAAVANPTFDDMTIVSGTTTTETTYADFVPVMNPTSLTGGDKSILFVTGGDKLTYPNTTGNINGFRAYFQLHDLPNEARSFAMSFDDETTAVRGIENGELRVENSYYDLQGRRVVQPTKGLYIVNGKKLIIK